MTPSGSRAIRDLGCSVSTCRETPICRKWRASATSGAERVRHIAQYCLCRATDCNRDQAWHQAESIHPLIRFGSLPDQQQSFYCFADRQVLPDQQYSRAAPVLCELPEMLRHSLEIMGDQNPAFICSERQHCWIRNSVKSCGLRTTEVHQRFPASRPADDRLSEIIVRLIQNLHCR